MLLQKCALRRMSLPLLPCDCDLCDWYIRHSGYNCCFWVLAYCLEEQPGVRFTLEQISEIEGISVEDATKLYESALFKLRQGPDSVAVLEAIGEELDTN